MKARPGKLGGRYLSDYLRQNAASTPDKLALVDERLSLSWRELWEQVEPRALSLASQLGNEQQQIVGLLMPNTWQYVVSYLAIIHAGHIALPIDVIYKSLEIDAVIDQVRPVMVITDQTNRPRITTKKSPVKVFEDLDQTTTSKTKLLRLPDDEQIACLLFTSGTSGVPKLVPNTHANLIWNIKVCSQAWGWDSSDSLLLSLRLSHMHGLVIGLTGMLYHGNSLYLQDRFDPIATLKLLSLGKITQFPHGPLAYAKLLEVKDGQKYDLSKVKLFISGSAPLPPAIWQEFKKRYGHEILEVYGTTETGRIASNLRDERIAGSPGRPLAGVEIKFGDQNEVMIKSPGVFPGYYKNQRATKESLAPGGWWRTGDIGELKDGRLLLKGRLQEKIRKSGYSLSPRDIEWAMHQMPSVREIYVMGLQQAGSANDLLVYYLVSDATKEEIMAFCNDNLPSVWRPDKIVFVKQIPRTRSGKPQLMHLKDLAQSGVAV